ncbi:MAG: class I SAM-dependent methyltransferase [Planctomycetes bacterium]|nr:class I SAM-dependent methyltransferase [Planctomycetota bacterium]
MSRKTIQLTDALQAYLVEQTVTETEVMRRLREETDALPLAEMQIAPEQGQFMRLLVELLGARNVLEIGTFTGYSALWLVSGLPADGRLICCDVSEEWTAIARRYWAAAGVAHRIDLRLGPALATIDSLLHAGAAGTFDFVFIDADKENSARYYEQALRLLRVGGLVAVDNAFHGGRVAETAVTDEEAPHRGLNHAVCHDQRVAASLVPVGDGLLLARKC